MEMRSRTFVFVRHGVTNWNHEGRFQGQLDIPLNNEGSRQARVLKEHLPQHRFDCIYTSPLRRALETARVIAGNLPVVMDWRLAEIDHGDWQGKTKEEIATHWPDLWDRWEKDPLQVTPTSGESPEQVRQRVDDFLRSVTAEIVLCVSHGVVIQTVRSLLLTDEPGSPGTPRNGSIHTFSVCGNALTGYRFEEIV